MYCDVKVNLNMYKYLKIKLLEDIGELKYRLETVKLWYFEDKFVDLDFYQTEKAESEAKLLILKSHLEQVNKIIKQNEKK